MKVTKIDVKSLTVLADECTRENVHRVLVAK